MSSFVLFGEDNSEVHLGASLQRKILRDYQEETYWKRQTKDCARESARTVKTKWTPVQDTTLADVAEESEQ